jgi:predicted Zn-dependent protease
MTRQQCFELARRILAMSRADETFVTLTGLESTTLPLLLSAPQPAAFVRDRTVQVAVRVGDRYASMSGNQYDDASLRVLLDTAIAAAGMLPAVQSVLPYAGTLEVREAPLGLASDPAETARWRAAGAKTMLDRATREGLIVTGKLSTSDSYTALASSNGLLAYQPSSSFHCVARVFTKDGSTAGYGEQRGHSTADVNAEAVIDRAARKAMAWKGATSLKRERIFVVFEPQAMADLLMPILRQFDQQAIDENRSFLRKLDGSSRVGSEVFAKDLNIRSDPYASELPSVPFALDGQAVPATSWVNHGVIEAVTMSRFLAKKTSTKALPSPTNLLVSGGTQSTADIIAATEYGLLVSGFGPVAVEDPTDCVLAASTRDGLFLIENGVVTRPIQNMTMRENAVHILKMAEKIGVPERVHPRATYFPMMVPAMQVRDVRFAGHSGVI